MRFFHRHRSSASEPPEEQPATDSHAAADDGERSEIAQLRDRLVDAAESIVREHVENISRQDPRDARRHRDRAEDDSPSRRRGRSYSPSYARSGGRGGGGGLRVCGSPSLAMALQPLQPMPAPVPVMAMAPGAHQYGAAPMPGMPMPMLMPGTLPAQAGGQMPQMAQYARRR
ncbi:hypothetical protein EXIGLDRAFT_761579 [Exidia glandulosa HHB12029]|uniref:Uncharacterized protein n=1 Tax=Exidia glandulosa HHB12029 TaxID=1314781 RepID=A0A165NB52_EXIGL|nr:hypothetical protein EXIGLDRAFT_761579 [Exidia glandulosa HHB12029]